jgi:hypothetical protein
MRSDWIGILCNVIPGLKNETGGTRTQFLWLAREGASGG